MFFLFVCLKVPLLALCWLVWWAIHQTDDTAEDRDDGGSKRPHAPAPLPRTPRRGPHGDPAPLPPPRVRVTTARARERER